MRIVQIHQDRFAARANQVFQGMALSVKVSVSSVKQSWYTDNGHK